MSRSKRNQQPRQGTILPELRITASVLERIASTIGTWPAETGGILGGYFEDGVVREFEFDAFADRSGGTYSPDCDWLNRLLGTLWNPQGIRMLGFVHSHPRGAYRPSWGDLIYAERILRLNPELDRLLLPIVAVEDIVRPFEFRAYCAVLSGGEAKTEPMALEVLEDDDPRLFVPASPAAVATDPPDTSPHSAAEPVDFNTVEPMTSLEDSHTQRPVDSSTANSLSPRTGPSQNGHAAGNPAQSDSHEEPPAPAGPHTASSADPHDIQTQTFSRVTNAVDLDRMAHSRVIVIGAGGARQMVTSLARSGVREFCLLDMDKIETCNLATQHVYRTEIGLSKVECLAREIRDINPAALVLTSQQPIEELSDEHFALLASGAFREIPLRDRWFYHPRDEHRHASACQLKPAATLLCGFTDSFMAQWRVNLLGLKFGLPTLCAQVYAMGIGAEITFTYPGITPACHRCVLRSRFDAYLEGDLGNPVTSDGTPIFATERLNALKGFIALGILHHGTEHPRFGPLLKQIGNRNLVQIRMLPGVELPAFEQVLAGADQDRLLFDDVVWLPQLHDHPDSNGYSACPDCQGTGDLRNRIGSPDDTQQVIAGYLTNSGLNQV